MSNQPKTGIYCLIGNLEKFGYHHIHEIVLRSFCAFADRVVLISSSREPRVKINDPKIRLVSSAETWFDLDENGDERYSNDKLVANSVLGLNTLAEDNLDIALNLSINQYIPETHFTSLRRYIQDFYKRGRPLTWLYKMYQCGPQLYDADRRLPWIFNLHHRQRYQLAPDSIYYFKKWLFWCSTKRIAIQTGWYKAYNNISIVDVMGEFTEKENAALWTFVDTRSGYTTANAMVVNGVYQHEVFLNHLSNKLKAKHISSEPLDSFGTAICRQNRPDFVCHELLRKAGQ